MDKGKKQGKSTRPSGDLGQMKGGARLQSKWRHGRCFNHGGHQNHVWSVRNKTKQNQKRKKWLPGCDCRLGVGGPSTHP